LVAQFPAERTTFPPFAAQGVYFAVDPEQPTYARLGRMIAQAFGQHSLLVIPFPEVVAWLIALGNQLVNTAQGRSDTFNVDKIREATAGNWTSSVARLRNDFGFHPGQPLQTRLNETAQWYRTHGWV
jgi:nucleoside-diphosphate-sugar epimerase